MSTKTGTPPKPALKNAAFKRLALTSKASGAFQDTNASNFEQKSSQLLKAGRRRESATDLINISEARAVPTKGKGTDAADMVTPAAGNASCAGSPEQLDRIERSLAQLTTMMAQMAQRNDRLAAQVGAVVGEVEFVKSALGAQAAFIDKALGTDGRGPHREDVFTQL
jgi:hypothetical protein